MLDRLSVGSCADIRSSCWGSIHGSHFGTDARFCYLLLDELVSLVIEDLQDTGKSTVAMTSLPWGTEVSKLQPSAALAMSGSGDNTATQNATSATETANDPVDIRAEPSDRLTTPVPVSSIYSCVILVL